MEEKRIRINGEDTNYIVREDGTIINTKFNHILKGTLQRNEYHTVYLIHNGKQYNYMTHRLVAEYFCENPNGYTVVHHKDGNPHNNAASNLQWVSTEINNATENRRTPAKKRMAEKVEELNLDEWTPVLDGGLGVNKKGQVMNLNTKRPIYGTPRNGYIRFNYKGIRYTVHCLIWEAFNGPIPQGMVIDHIDSNRANNELSNLRMITQSENMKNAMANGHKCQTAVLQYDLNGNLVKEYMSISAAARAIGMVEGSLRYALNKGKECGGYFWKKKIN